MGPNVFFWHSGSYFGIRTGTEYGVCLNVKIRCSANSGKGLTSWLSFVMSNCEFDTFPLVSWVRCGT